MSYQSNFQAYLAAVKKPFEKVVRIDFLQPDEKSVAFSLGNKTARGYMRDYNTSAFIQSGTLNVSLQNGTRRTCSIKLANVDGAFDFAVNKVWFGDRIRLEMGIVLPDGTPFYIPQGVFVVKDPSTVYSPSERSITYSLTDKFALLDGTMSGRLSYALQIPSAPGNRPKVFEIVSDLLKLSKYTMSATGDPAEYIDPAIPKFTNYFDGRTTTVTYLNGATETVSYDAVTYDLALDNGSTLADAIKELNTLLSCWYGYDAAGRFFFDPSQDELTDTQKPLVWSFTEKDGEFFNFSENLNINDLTNNVVVCGNGLTYANYYGRAYNADPASPTNVNKIGLKTYYETSDNLCSETQCKDYATFLLRRKMMIQSSVTITCGQLFHLRENALVSVKREDKGGETRQYLINSYSLPLADEGSMQISCSAATNDENFHITTEGGLG